MPALPYAHYTILTDAALRPRIAGLMRAKVRAAAGIRRSDGPPARGNPGSGAPRVPPAPGSDRPQRPGSGFAGRQGQPKGGVEPSVDTPADALRRLHAQVGSVRPVRKRLTR